MITLAFKTREYDTHFIVRRIGKDQDYKIVYRIRKDALHRIGVLPGAENDFFRSADATNETFLSLLERLTEEEISASIDGYINRLLEVRCVFGFMAAPLISKYSPDKPRYHVAVIERSEDDPLLFDTLEEIDAFISQQHSKMSKSL